MQNPSKKICVIIVTGPTASGKSNFCLKLAKKISGEIVNADSMQVYKELNILTDRPNKTDQKQISHHLYGHVSVKKRYSAGSWREHAIQTIYEINKRGNIPLVCGGTGLYLKILKEGLTNTPDVAQKHLETASLLYDMKGKTAALSFLQNLNPQDPIKLQANDRQRIIRALSVFFATGKSLLDWQHHPTSNQDLNISYLTLALCPPRDQLYRSINERFDQMITLGAIHEAQEIIKLSLDPALPSMKAVGVRELGKPHITKICLNNAIDKAKQSTRNLAKRQLSWLRNHSKPDLIINKFGPQVSLCPHINTIKEFLYN